MLEKLRCLYSSFSGKIVLKAKRPQGRGDDFEGCARMWHHKSWCLSWIMSEKWLVCQVQRYFSVRWLKYGMNFWVFFSAWCSNNIMCILCAVPVLMCNWNWNIHGTLLYGRSSDEKARDLTIRYARIKQFYNGLGTAVLSSIDWNCARNFREKSIGFSFFPRNIDTTLPEILCSWKGWKDVW